MEKQTFPQPTDRVQNSKIILAIVISGVATALIAGGGICLWRKSSLDAAGQKLQQQLVLLQNQINELQKENADLKATEEKECAPTITISPSDTSSNIKFHIVIGPVYTEPIG